MDQRGDSFESHRLSAEFKRLSEVCRSGPMTFRDLVGTITTRTHALLTLVLSIPFLLPIPLPGLSIPFGALIIIAGFRMIWGLPPWVPGIIGRRTIPSEVLAKIFLGGESIMKKLERWVRPRGYGLTRRLMFRTMTASMILISGFFLALPLPPGTNFPPALTIVLLSVGELEDDGLFLIFGSIAFLLTSTAFTVLPWLGIESLIHYWSN